MLLLLLLLLLVLLGGCVFLGVRGCRETDLCLLSSEGLGAGAESLLLGLLGCLSLAHIACSED